MRVSSLSSLVRRKPERQPARGLGLALGRDEKQADSVGLAEPLRIEDDFPMTQFFDRDDLGLDSASTPSTKEAA